MDASVDRVWKSLVSLPKRACREKDSDNDRDGVGSENSIKIDGW